MTELKFYIMMSDIDDDLIQMASQRPALYRRPPFRIAMVAAAIALLLAASMLIAPFALVVSYSNTHPEIDGGLIYVMDAMIKDEDHFLSSLLPEDVKNTLGSVFDALTGGDDEGGNESETEIGGESESETESEFVMPPASKGLRMEFNENHDGYRVMGMGSCKDKNLVIPAEYNGLPVTEIYWNSPSGDNAFEGNTLIESLIIPASVQSINRYAFYKCTSLKSVIIVEGEKPLTIGMCAFSGCPLEEFVVPENTIRFLDPFGFTNTDSTYEKTFPQVTEYQNAYYLGDKQNPYRILIRIKDESMTVCEIHPDTKIIGGGAFYKSSITDIIIPEGVFAIDDRAFAKTSSLQSLSIPDSLRFVGKDVFDDSAVVVSESYMDYAGTKENPYLILIGGELSDRINPATRFVADEAFTEERCNPKITSLTIPESVHYIGNDAFNGMKNNFAIQTLTVLGDDLYIGVTAFATSNRLMEITIGEGVSHISPTAFNMQSSLTKITVQDGNPNYFSKDNCLIERNSGTLILGCRNSIIPSDGSILHIAKSAFFGAGIPYIEIPEGVISIGSLAFFSLAGGIEITIPHSVTCIQEYAFSGGSQIHYNGTKKEWLTIQSEAVSSRATIYCTDGELVIEN